MENNLYKTKLWKRILSVILAVIIGFGTFVTMTFANVLLSDYVDLKSVLTVKAARLEVTLPDGSKYPMIRKDSTTYVDELNRYTLTKTDDNYIFDDGTYKYYFAIKALNSVAYLSVIEDNNGNKLNLNRTTNTDEVSISDASGRKFSLSDYQAINAPDGSDVKYYSQKEITDPNGNKLKYTTKQGKYIEIKDQAGVILGKYEYTNNTTDFTLVKSNDNKIEYYSNGRLKQITYKNGSWIKYTYNDSSMNYTTLTSSGETTKTVYNDAFLPVEYTDESGTKTEYAYDSHYRVKTEKSGDENTAYTYDSKGNVLSYVTSNEKNNTYYTYNSAGKVIREQTDNNYTYYTYDSNGNVTVLATLKKDFKGEIPKNHNFSLTCFD